MLSPIQVPLPGYAHYSASKAGVVSLTKSTAKELATYGIRCNAVLPGPTTTPMLANVTKEVLDAAANVTPLGRQGKPEGKALF